MMAAQFPAEPIDHGLRHPPADSATFVRLEYGEGDPAWLMADARRAADGRLKSAGTTFRAIVGKVASLLF